MNTWVRSRWNALRSTYWFLPGAMTLGAAGLAVVSLAVDRRLRVGYEGGAPWIYGGGSEGARVLMNTVAGAMLGVAGVTFSVMIVALTMAATQLGPRLLRRFLRDRGNQFVLGSFLGTSLYCLVALLAVRADGVVPALSVSVGMALTFLSIAVLIYFIHHVSSSIQADQVVAGVSRELLAAIERVVREEGADAPGREDDALGDAAELELGAEALEVIADRGGYVAAVDYSGLLRLAEELDLALSLEVRAGHFVLEGSRLARVAPRAPGGPAALGEEQGEDVVAKVRAAFLLGHMRTEDQGLDYAVTELVEIALRALSPGVNDAFTAVACIDWLSAALAKLARRGLPTRRRHDTRGVLRVVTAEPSFADMARLALDPIRHDARRVPLVAQRLLTALRAVAGQARTRAAREVLREHGDAVLTDARASLYEGRDLRAIEREHDALIEALELAEQAPAGAS